jgi:putative mafB-like protein
VNQDPIGLKGGDNFYQFAPNTHSWIDPSGNIAFIPILIAMGVGALSGAATDAGMQVASNVINGKEWNDIDYGSVALGAGIGAITGPVLGKAAKLYVGKCQAKNFFKGTRYTEKVKKQASSGDYHSFPEAVDSFSKYGKVSKIKGGDGITRQKLEIPGGYKGKEGVFEYIKEPNGNINHRLFKPNK